MADTLATIIPNNEQAQLDELIRRQQARGIQARPPGPPVPGQPAPPPEHVEEQPSANDNGPGQVAAAEALWRTNHPLAAQAAANRFPATPSVPFPANQYGSYSRVIPAPAGGGEIQAGDIPPGASQATGPGGPLVSLPRAGAQVEADPAWRQAWDAGAASDARNPLIAALGGPAYGHPGQLPTVADAARAGISAQDYAHLMNAGGQQLLGTGQLGVSGMNAATQRLAVENAGRADQIAADSRGANQYATFLTQHAAQHPEASASEHHEYASGQSGMPTERYLQLTSATPLHPSLVPGSVTAAPAGTPIVNRNGPVTPNPVDRISRQRPGSTEKPWANIERQLDAASGYGPQAAGGQPSLPPGATVGGFINKLESTNPGMLAEQLPRILPYMSNRFGDAAVEDAIRRRSEPRQIAAPSNILQGALRAVPAAATIWRQLASGPTDEERGLSVFGHLNDAINKAGSHDAFLRQQLGRRGPLPNAAIETLRRTLPGERAIANLPD